MELRQLEHFVAVAEERHFTRAARRMNIVQSGLSASIRGLEDELGAKLFARNTRHVELTEAGRALLAEARRALAAVQSARDAVNAVQGLQRGTLTVGIMQRFAAAFDLPALLGRFHAEHPGIKMRLRQAAVTVLMAGVRDGRLDLAILAEVGAPPEGVRTRLLAQAPMVLALPPKHHLAGRKPIALSALGGEEFVEFQSDWAVRMIADRAFAAAGIARRVTCEVNDVGTLLDLVAHGLGIALVPRPFVSYETNVRFQPVRPPVPSWDVAVAIPGEEPANPAARALLAALLATAKVERPT